MARKTTFARLLAGLVATAPLTVLLFAQCGSTAVTGGPADTHAVIADLGMDDATVIADLGNFQDSATGDGASPADGMPAVLGSAQTFAVLGGQTVTSTGETSIVGNLGVSPGGSLTGFPPGTVTAGTTHVGDAVALQAQLDVTAAYNSLKAVVCNVNLTGQELSGLTLQPGVYCFSAEAAITLTTNLVLDAQGDPNAVFVFQIGSTFTAGNNTAVKVINGGSDCNVYWQVGSSATVGTGTAFAGNILAFSSITLMTGASVSGRVLARNAAITMDTNDVSFATCAAVPPSADLDIRVTSGQTSAVPGSPFVYLVTVTNRGPSNVQNAAVTTQLRATGGPVVVPVSWTCSATANARCGMLGGTDNIDATVNLPVDGTAVFVVTATFPAQSAGTLEYRAQVAPSKTVPDPGLTNNSATYTVSITANGSDMAGGDAADMASGDASDGVSPPKGQLAGGGLACNATGSGTSTVPLKSLIADQMDRPDQMVPPDRMGSP